LIFAGGEANDYVQCDVLRNLPYVFWKSIIGIN